MKSAVRFGGSASYVRLDHLAVGFWVQQQSIYSANCSLSVRSRNDVLALNIACGIPVLIGATLFQEGGNEGLAFALDLSKQKQAEAEIRALRDQLYRENLALRDEVDRAQMCVWIAVVTPSSSQYASPYSLRLIPYRFSIADL